MKPSSPMTLVVNAQVQPSSVTGTDATFGVVTMRLRVKRGGMQSPTSDTELFVLPVAAAQEIARMLVQASDQAAREHGAQP